MRPNWAMLATLDCLAHDILAKYFSVQFGGLSCQWGVKDNNHVCISHLCAFLQHGTPWPFRGLVVHHGIHGPRVAFACAPQQIKRLVSLLLLSSGLLGLALEWWP